MKDFLSLICEEEGRESFVMEWEKLLRIRDGNGLTTN